MSQSTTDQTQAAVSKSVYEMTNLSTGGDLEDTDLEAQTRSHSKAILPNPRNWGLSLKFRHREEAPPLENDLQLTPLRRQALDLLFGFTTEDVLQWPGILTFCDHLEKSCFPQLLEPQFGALWPLLGRDSPSGPADCWHWCFKVMEIFQSLSMEDDDDPSLETVYSTLVSRTTKAKGAILAKDKLQIVRAIFATLCWISATLTPLIRDPKLDNTLTPIPKSTHGISLIAKNTYQIYSSKDLRRPVSKLFYAFRTGGADEFGAAQQGTESIPAPGNNGTTAGKSDNDVLYESSLSYFSLLQIGRVKLEWVDTITAHLAFDRSTRTLSVFRFPSFCVANILKKHDGKLIANLTTRLLPPQCYSDTVAEPVAVYREMILSYRLLFGQSTTSRKLLVRLLTKRNSINHDAGSAASNPREEIDPFLLKCTEPIKPRQRFGFVRLKQTTPRILFPSNLFPVSALDMDDQIQDSDTFSAKGDFPVFGQRLLALQNYNMRQQPSKVTDLWRDRRNPLQWYTFWAVFWVGGASILLGLLQLFVAIAQTVIALRDTGTTDN